MIHTPPFFKLKGYHILRTVFLLWGITLPGHIRRFGDLEIWRFGDLEIWREEIQCNLRI
jgi:hypothetical protein